MLRTNETNNPCQVRPFGRHRAQRLHAAVGTSNLLPPGGPFSNSLVYTFSASLNPSAQLRVFQLLGLFGLLPLSLCIANYIFLLFKFICDILSLASSPVSWFNLLIGLTNTDAIWKLNLHSVGTIIQPWHPSHLPTWYNLPLSSFNHAIPILFGLLADYSF